MQSLDLNLNNYTLDEILSLFKLSYGYNLSDLKQAKLMVMKLHPDKSKLPVKFFDFFSDAFKILVNVYAFNCKSNDVRNRYNNNDEETIDVNILRFSTSSADKSSDFNKKFNNIFDKCFIQSEEQNFGYGELLSNEVCSENYETKKARLYSEMIIYKEPDECNRSHSNISGDKPPNYCSDIGDKMHYSDLQESFNKSVFQITEAELNKIETFRSVMDLQSFRSSMDMTPIPNSEKVLEDKSNYDHELSLNRAFSLIKQSEQMQKQQQAALKDIHLLEFQKST